MPKSAKASSKASKKKSVQAKKAPKTNRSTNTSTKSAGAVKKVKLPKGVTVDQTPVSIRKDLTGQRFGRLTVLGFGGYRSARSTWKCQCDCGNVKCYFRSNIQSGTSTQCIDCARTEHRIRSTSHGMWGTPEYRTWERVQKSDTVTTKWRKFETFYSDLGPRPSASHSLMRIRSDQGWSKANATWIHSSKVGEHRSSQTLVKNGSVTKPATLWAAELGITVQAFRQRLRSGKTMKAIMAMPTRKSRLAPKTMPPRATPKAKTTTTKKSPPAKASPKKATKTTAKKAKLK